MILKNCIVVTQVYLMNKKEFLKEERISIILFIFFIA